MSLYDQYSNEAEFRANFVKPLLNRLGFFLVTDYHGRREFGKDFVFSELHRFGGVRHYAAQVKHERTIGLGKAVDDLLTQVNQAFANPFTLPDSHQSAYISAIYVFNSGSITDEAKDDLINRLGRERYGENVYFLDGERLDSLNTWATYQEDKEARHRLTGLKLQLRLNSLIWKSIEDSLKTAGKFREARGPILTAVESFLTAPLFPEDINLDDLAQIWQDARIIDAINTRYLLASPVKQEIREKDMESALKLVKEVLEYSDKVIRQVDVLLLRLKPL
jgi:hypothetical protein